MPCQRLFRKSQHVLQRLTIYNNVLHSLSHFLISRLNTDTASFILKEIRITLEMDVLKAICELVKWVARPQDPLIRQLCLCSLSSQLAAHRYAVIKMYYTSQFFAPLLDGIIKKLYEVREDAESSYVLLSNVLDKKMYKDITKSLRRIENASTMYVLTVYVCAYLVCFTVYVGAYLVCFTVCMCCYYVCAYCVCLRILSVL